MISGRQITLTARSLELKQSASTCSVPGSSMYRFANAEASKRPSSFSLLPLLEYLLAQRGTL